MSIIFRYFHQPFLIILTSLALLELVTASNIDTTNKFAWSTNAGWFNFRPSSEGVTVYDDHLEGYAWAENIGWIKLGSYDGGENHQYANTSSTNWGVNNDGSGNLSGYAWSPKVGWIKFKTNLSQVTVDSTSGDFDGFAWSENIGWIHFQHEIAPAYKVQAYVGEHQLMPPIEPAELVTTVISPTEINLVWIDNSRNETGFKIEREGRLIHTTEPDVTHYQDSGLTCDTTYDYAIKATNAIGDSTAITISVTTSACPVVPPPPENSSSSDDENFNQPLPPTMTLTISFSGDGEGKAVVEPEPMAVHCDELKCIYTINTATWIIVTPQAEADSEFRYWGVQDDCAKDKFFLFEPKSCTAYFEKLPDASTENSTEQDTVINTPPISDCENNCEAANTPVTLPPNHQPVITEEHDNVTSIAPEIQLYPVTLTIAEHEGGLIYNATDDTTCRDECTQDYVVDSQIQLIAQPDEGWTFVKWHGECTGTETETQVTIAKAITCEAQFTFLTEPTFSNETTELVITSVIIPVTTSEPENRPPCPIRGWLNWVCNAKGRTLTQLKVGNRGDLSNGVLEGTLTNQGWVANLIIKPTGKVTGGIVTGYIQNEGMMEHFEFRGRSIIGGTLGGIITNTSTIGGYFQDVHLAPQTHIIGGYLMGHINGDPPAAALLSSLVIRPNSYLTNVIIDHDVKWLDPVHFGENVTFLVRERYLERHRDQIKQLPSLGAIGYNRLGKTVTTYAELTGGISVNGSAFQKEVTQRLSDSVDIFGNLFVDVRQLQQPADIVVYAAYTPATPRASKPQYFMVDTNHNIQPWDGNIKHLVAFQTHVKLAPVQPVKIFSGHFSVSGKLEIVFGYRLENGLLVIPAETLQVSITN